MILSSWLRRRGPSWRLAVAPLKSNHSSKRRNDGRDHGVRRNSRSLASAWILTCKGSGDQRGCNGRKRRGDHIGAIRPAFLVTVVDEHRPAARGPARFDVAGSIADHGASGKIDVQTS